VPVAHVSVLLEAAVSTDSVAELCVDVGGSGMV
jgi:hypothetical protein